MRLDCLAAYVFALGMILSIYGVSIVTFYIICSLLCMLFVKIMYKHIRLVYTKPFFAFIISFFVMRIIRGDIVHPPLGIILFLMMIGFFCGHLKTDLFIKAYRTIANINIIAFYAQIIMKMIYGYSFSNIFFFLPLASADEFEIDIATYQEKLMYAERSSGFFSEPSHLAGFLLPLLCLELFYGEKNNNRKLYSLFLFITLLLTMSGCAFTGLLVISIMCIISILRKLSYRRGLLILAFSIPVFFLCGYVFSHSKVGEIFVERQEEFSGDDENASGFIRAVRGYYVYDELGFKERILGVSSNQLKTLVEKSVWSSSFALDRGIYLNFVQRLIICEGAISTFLFLLFLFCLFKHCNYAGKSIILIFIVMSFIESLYFSAEMQLFIISAFLMSNNKKKLKTISI